MSIRYIQQYAPATITEFILLGINGVYKEIELFQIQNKDPAMLFYANEASLSSFFVNGLIREDGKLGKITTIQDYSINYNENSSVLRPDIFVRYNEAAIWIESKYDRSDQSVRSDHWDMKGWFDWDTKFQFNQVKKYYDMEKTLLNDSYKDRFIMTLCFKLLLVDEKTHTNEAENNLLPYIFNKYERSWFYAADFYPALNNQIKTLCLETYGTFIQTS